MRTDQLCRILLGGTLSELSVQIVYAGDLDPITWEPFPESAAVTFMAAAATGQLQQQHNRQQPATRKQRPSQGSCLLETGTYLPAYTSMPTHPSSRLCNSADCLITRFGMHTIPEYQLRKTPGMNRF